ncbi:MAG: hypothetical protein ACT4QF_08225 [Sporichthyaceae bacterium]
MARAGDPVLRRERRRFWWRVLRNTVAFSAVAAAVGWSLAFHSNYGSWPFLDVGERISWCGRDYEQSVTDMTIDEVNAKNDPDVGQLFRYPPKLSQQTVLGSPGPCPDRLYIRASSDRYTEFLAPGTQR